jgi:cytidine deaminase
MSDLFEAARAVREHAYAPFSHFKVGAALRSTSGRIYVGCNVENSAYPEGLCAEAGAIAAMIANGDTQIAEVCIVSGDSRPASPCGGCRQKLAEFAPDATPIHLATVHGIDHTQPLGDLLPGAFRPDHLQD